MASKPNFWLMKTEPEVFSFDTLLSSPKKTAPWEGVRNYQARNFMRDNFRVGDGVFIYHSSCASPGIAGLAKVVRAAYPDPTALDVKSKYFDPASKKLGESRWVMVDVQATHRLQRTMSLQDIKAIKELSSMLVIKRGMRLSIQPVTLSEWNLILALGHPTAC